MIVGGPSGKIMEIPGGGGSKVKPSGTENPEEWGLKLEKTLRGGYGYFLEPHIQKRASALANWGSTWRYTHRKTHSGASSERDRTLAFELWESPGNSCPTGNKSNVKRKHLGSNEYIEHGKQILEETQSEIFQDFK